jgi:hypothetical protein
MASGQGLLTRGLVGGLKQRVLHLCVALFAGQGEACAHSHG